MTTYVLMVFVTVHSVVGSSSAATAGHFYSKERCEVARNTIIEELKTDYTVVNAFCLEE